MPHAAFFRERSFWIAGLATLAVLGGLFLWQLGLIPGVWSPSRPAPTNGEYAFAATLLLLISMSSGLLAWHNTHRSCPIGAKRAGGIAGTVGALTLLCPACTALPLTLLGAGATLSILGPFIPLLRIVALLIAVVTLFILWPRRHPTA